MYPIKQISKADCAELYRERRDIPYFSDTETYRLGMASIFIRPTGMLRRPWHMMHRETACPNMVLLYAGARNKNIEQQYHCKSLLFIIYIYFKHWLEFYMEFFQIKIPVKLYTSNKRNSYSPTADIKLFVQSISTNQYFQIRNKLFWKNLVGSKVVLITHCSCASITRRYL